MQNLSSDRGDADPCQGLKDTDQGGVYIKRDTMKGQSDKDKPVNIMLICSPLLDFPFGTLSTDSWIGCCFYNNSYPRDRPVFVGDRGAVSNDGKYVWNNTAGFPFIHGDIANALRLAQFQVSDIIAGALIGAIGSAVTATAIAAIACAVGGAESLGGACAGVVGVIGYVAFRTVASAATGIVSAFVKEQYNRIVAMANADWFVWSNTAVYWNTFGSLTDKTINPSLTDLNANPFHKDRVRVGIQFANVPIGNGPEFFSAKDGGSKTSASKAVSKKQLNDPNYGKNIAKLNFNTDDRGFHPNGRHRVRTGSSGSDVLTGASGDDTLTGRSGRDKLEGKAGEDILDAGAGADTLDGGTGRDTLYAGAGNDRASGGEGQDILDGAVGDDTLDGGPGSDWLIDYKGATIVRTGETAGGKDKGSGKDFVNVRDGENNDTVTCGPRPATVIVDAGDTVIGCKNVIRKGKTLTVPKNPMKNK